MRKYLFLTGLLVLLFSLAGCNKLASPEERLNEYTKLWNDQNFAEMYKSYVAPSTKEKVKKEDYVDRYQTIYKSLGIKSIKVTPLAKEEKDWKGKKPFFRSTSKWIQVPALSLLKRKLR